MSSRGPIRGSRGQRMDVPRDRGISIRDAYDPERFGRLSEKVARYIGSWAFIAWMTVVVITWVLWNTLAPADVRPDPYPFIFLTLLLSLQASYAAPLILLAQNRQEERDRRQAENDRAVAASTQANAEFLARELASVRLSLSNVVTVDELRDQLDDVLRRLNDQKS